MDEFSYLSVLLSIIIGLAITQILQGLRGILLARSRVRMYWPVLAWAALLLILAVQTWWTMFGLRDVHVWTFPKFSVVLAQTIVLYMLTAIVLPDFGGENVDLGKHYHAHTRWFFSLLILLLLVSLGKDLVLYDHLPEPINVTFHLCFVAVSLSAMFVRRERYHKALPVIGLLAFVAYIGLLFVRLH
ncbi:MAG: hypothetical protein P4L92_17535 [Rudaea sp.]|nr:hypothetical protein [Rudaea sp.]